jgi:hypothetical protein
MKLHVDHVEQKAKVLIVSRKNYHFVELLKNELKKYNPQVFFSPVAPADLSIFDYCFFINEKITQTLFRNLSTTNNKKKVTFVFLDNVKTAEEMFKKKNKGVKIINVTGHPGPQELDNILWFSLSQTQESYLRIQVPELQAAKPKSETRKNTFTLEPYLKRVNITKTIVAFVLFFHLAFIPLLFASSYLTYKAAVALKDENVSLLKNELTRGKDCLALTKKLYRFARPTLLLFSLAIIPDNLIDINDKTQQILTQSISALENSRSILRLVVEKNKTPADKATLIAKINTLKMQTRSIEDNLLSLNQKIPGKPQFLQTIKTQLIELTGVVVKVNKILPHLGSILASGTEKEYLLLFANNRELRPGGGFIGSFGTIKFKDHTLDDLKVYDVYDADGQLIAHIEPPEPIRKYLQVHWFLRDSAFSPDFLENYAQAKFFLEKEMGMNNFSGAFLLTTTAIENLLGAYGEVYLPDFDETINQSNFYLKTQVHAEGDFFPGSIQKKSYLAALTKQILINLENASLSQVGAELKRSLDEKQIAIFFDDPVIQDIIDSSYWSGRVIDVKCPTKIENCIVDYLFPFDANLGINKANYYITRFMHMRVNIDSLGNVNHILTLQFQNDSPADIFPVGTYRNYFQVLLPRGSVIKYITKDGILVEEYDEEDDQFKKVGFMFEVPPKRKTEIALDYRLSEKIEKGKGVYQLTVQKQIGLPNSDFSLEVNLPQNIYLLNQNFSPLVISNQIIYNTYLAADKIFFIELIKE